MINKIMGRIPFLNKRIDAHMRETVSGTSVSFLLKVAGSGLAFIFNLLLARLLGAEGVGIYFLALTVVTIASVISRIGLDFTMLRFIATNASQNDWKKVAGVVKEGITIASVASLFATIILLLISSPLSNRVFSKPDLILPLSIMACGIVPLTLLTLYAESLRGLKNIRDSIFIQNVSIPLINLIIIIPLVSLYKINGMALAYMTATFFTLLLAIYLWRKSALPIKGLRGHFDRKKLLSAGLPMLLVASMNMIMGWTDTLMLGMWTSSESVGIYNIALKVAGLTVFILSAVNSVVGPQFAVLFAQGDKNALEKLASDSAKMMTILSLPLFLLFLLFPAWILSFFGPEFISGSTTLAVLALGQFVNVMAGSVGNVLVMSGKERLFQYIVMVSALLNIILNALFIPLYGILGAGIATSVSMIVINVAGNIACRASLDVRINIWPAKLRVEK